MKLKHLEGIIKKETPIFYRSEYKAHANMELLGREHQIPVSFDVEMLPTGEKLISVKLDDKVDYPELPILKVLKEHIIDLEKDGSLPR